jgi:uncharacterized coiled-coil protein SlyX
MALSKKYTCGEDVEILTQLYFYAARLQDLNTSGREQLFRDLDSAVTPQSPLVERLKLALLIGGIEPELTDYNRARYLLRTCLAQASTQLLTAYIRASLDMLNRDELAQMNNQRVRQELMKDRQKSRKLKDQIDALETDVKLKETEIEFLRLNIVDKENHIEALKAKIEALTFIEQKLKDREQTPESENLDAKDEDPGK